MIRHLPGIGGTSFGPRDVESLGREDLTKPREIAAYEWLHARLAQEPEASPFYLMGVLESVLTYGGDTPATKVQKLRGHLAAYNDLRASGR